MIAQGGRSGVPVVPRVPQRSGLVLRMVADNEQQRMPRGRAKLADAEIMTIARWIEQGAAFDGKDQDAPIGDSMIVEETASDRCESGLARRPFPSRKISLHGWSISAWDVILETILVAISVSQHSNNCCRAARQEPRSCRASPTRVTSSILFCVRIH